MVNKVGAGPRNQDSEGQSDASVTLLLLIVLIPKAHQNCLAVRNTHTWALLQEIPNQQDQVIPQTSKFSENFLRDFHVLQKARTLNPDMLSSQRYKLVCTGLDTFCQSFTFPFSLFSFFIPLTCVGSSKPRNDLLLLVLPISFLTKV